MPFLDVTIPWKSQPTQFTGIDYQGLGKGARILFNPALGPVDLVTGRAWDIGGDAAAAVSQYGKVSDLDGSGDYLTYTGYDSLNGGGTLFIWFTRVGASGGSGNMLLGCETGGQTWFQIRTDGTVDIFARSSDTPLSGWFNTANRSLVLPSGDTAASMKAYVDGVDSGLTWSVDPAVFTDSGSKLLWLGRWAGVSGWDVDADILSFGWTSRVWGADEARAFHESQGRALFRPLRRSFWYSLASGAIDLVGANSAEANSSSTGAIAQIHFLTADNSTETSSSATGAISQIHFLTGTNCTEDSTSGTGAITAGLTLAGANSSEDSSSSTGAISQVHSLAGSNSTESSSAATGVITQIHTLTGANCTEANASSTGAITLGDIPVVTRRAPHSRFPRMSRKKFVREPRVTLTLP